MTYAGIVSELEIEKVCFGGCGLSDSAHRGSIFLDIVHWRERRVSKRGLRKLLLLAARRDRMLDPGFLNDERLYWWLYLYLDERTANGLAQEIGVRFPTAFSLPERRVVALIPGISRRHPQIYAWARRGEAP